MLTRECRTPGALVGENPRADALRDDIAVLVREAVVYRRGTAPAPPGARTQRARSTCSGWEEVNLGSTKAASGQRTVKYAVLEGVLRGLNVEPRSPQMAEVLTFLGHPEGPPVELKVERYAEMLYWLTRRHFPELPQEKGLFELGRRSFMGYGKTLLGQVQMAAMGLIGPDRLMRRTPDIFERNTNFGERTVEQIAPNTYVMRFRGIPLPRHYYEGIAVAGLRACGVEPQVSSTQVGPEDVDFRVHWS